MKNLSLAIVLLSLAALNSCATSHAARYAYGHDSFYADEINPEEGDALRAVFSPPLFVLAVAWDIIFLAPEAVFGVWPLWGDESLSMKPTQHR